RNECTPSPGASPACYTADGIGTQTETLMGNLAVGAVCLLALSVLSCAAADVPGKSLDESLRQCKDTDPKVRVQAVLNLGRDGKEPRAGDAAQTALKDPDERVREAAAGALGVMGPDAKAAVPALLDTLKDKSGAVRLRVLDALGQFGPDAKVAVPELTAALSDKDAVARSYAVHA